MGATTPRAGFALLLSVALLAGLMVASAVPVGADDDDDEMKKAFEQAGLKWGDEDDDEDDESGVGVDAFSGLAAGEGGDTSDGAPTGDLNNPLAGGTGGTSDGSDAEATGAEPGTTDSSDPTDPATSSANPMFKLMLDLILEDVQAKAKEAGRTLTEAEKTAVATESVKYLIAFLQKHGLLDEVDQRELLKQIEGIPTDDDEGGDVPATDASDGSAAADAPEPKKGPPVLTGKPLQRFEKQGREWVWLPAPAVIHENYPEVAKRKLKTGVWYQMKEHENGDREFFTKKSSRIGTSLPKDKDAFVVRRWEGDEEVGE